MRLARGLAAFSLWVERLAGLFLAVVALVVFVSAIGRYGFAAPIPDSFDLSRLLLGVVAMWGLATVGYRGAHIKVDLFVELLPTGLRRWIDLFAWTLLLGFTLLLAWKMLGRVESAWRGHEATFDLRLPIWPLLALAWLGVAASVVTVLARLVFLATGREDELAPHEPLEGVDER
jgi:TRAP-type C4-dicarboxylate transport system permease small subunit